MTRFDKTAAESTLDALHLARANGELAARWLSLWNDGSLPSSARFRPVNFRQFLPTLVLFQVALGKSITTRIAGTRYTHLLGGEVADPAARLGLLSAVAGGAMAIDHRRFVTSDGEEFIAEEIVLPFAPEADGTVTVLVHANVPVDRFLKIGSVAQACTDPIDRALLPLSPLAETSEDAAAA